jgi:DNA-binding PadR family transcriptional regulator
VVKQFQLRIPGVGKELASTVRASGPAVKEIVHLKDDIWQINLRRGMIGSVPVQIGYQDMTLREGDTETINPVQLLDSKQNVHYVAVRVPSRLEVSGNELREWRAFDWANVPSKLHNIADRSEPSLCYRVVDSAKSMLLTVKRHSMAGTLKLRVASGEMRTMFNSEGSALSRLSLAINVAEKSRLRISLPAGAELFNVIVNDKSAEVVKEGDAYWFFVSVAINDNEAAKVQITYQMQAGESSNSPITLLGPTLSIPLENIDWYVMLPDGYDLSTYEGGFDYQDTIINDDIGSYTEAFKKLKQARYYQLSEQGKQELDQAMNWSNTGQLDKANAALNRVYNNQAVDAASNEDARVKLDRNLTSQAIMGLNTRSQKQYMDNKAMGNTQRQNDALEEAVTRNPYFMGSKNFNPNQLGDYMQGNSDEEILAMQRIAKKLVKTQLISNDAGQAVELEILNTRKVLHFHKDLHLAGDRDLAIEIELDQTKTLDSSNSNSGSNFGIILILAIASLLGVWLVRK